MISKLLDSESKPVLIIGAGISGLSTARLLARNGIPVIVFEQSSPDRSQGYGITIRDWAYKPLLSDLGGIAVADLERAVAVDRGIGGCGWIDLTLRDNSTGVTLMAPDPPKPGETEQALFRANRTDLRNFLSDGVDLRYEHKLRSFEGQPGDVKAIFENGFEIEGSLLIAADGLHSTVRRTILPRVKPALLPVVVFHGDVYMSLEDFETKLKPDLGESNVTGGVGDNFNTPITIARADANGVHLDWSYSRSIAGNSDPLWMPHRDQTNIIPDQLLKEIGSKTMVPPFSTLLDPQSIKKDEVYNWLSRSVFIPRHNLDQALQQGVVFIGDASHAMPIFGGEGGNHAMLDGVELSRLFVERSKAQDGKPLQSTDLQDIVDKFYDGGYKRCQDAVKRCRQRFGLLHRPISEWRSLAEMARLRKAKAEEQEK